MNHVGLCVLLFQVGCFQDDGPVPTPLADFDGLEPLIGVSTIDDAASVSAELSYHFTSQCAALDASFTAKLGDVDVPILDRGSVITGEDSVDCRPPHLAFDSIPAELRTPGVLLVLEDDSLRISTNVGDALVQRTAEPIANPDWSFHVGQPVTFTWSPAADLAQLNVSAQFTPTSGTGGVSVGGFDIMTDADTLTFTVPAGVATGTLAFDLISTSPATLNQHHVVTHAVTLAP